MARGWESKSVESQIESAERPRRHSKAKRPTAAEATIVREKESLMLSRKRLLLDLEKASPRYRVHLEATLAALDRKIASIT
jgi:hypothetical protein